MEEVNEKEGNESKWGFDVTDLLRNFVAEELNDLQPMLHNDSFSLLESMSAIEARICICTKSIDILSCWSSYLYVADLLKIVFRPVNGPQDGPFLCIFVINAHI